MLTVHVKRSELTERVLLSGSGQRCILGHIARACGIPDKKLRGAELLCTLNPEEWPKIPEDLRPYSRVVGGHTAIRESEAAKQLMRLNDRGDPNKEAEMVELLSKHGILLVWEG